MNIIIIEDEIIAARSLKETIEALSANYTVTKILSSVEEAINYLKINNNYNLIFSDIQLGDGLSFDIFNRVTINSPVIFCTAFDEYAIQAFEANGIGYILKPFDTIKIKKVIDKFENLSNNNQHNPIHELLHYFEKIEKPNLNKSVLVYQKDKIIPINTNEIALIKLNNEIVELISFDGKKYFTNESLEYFEKLNLPFYFRANRQFIIHRKSVKDVEQHFNRKLSVNLTIPYDEQILISKEKTPAFLAWLTSV